MAATASAHPDHGTTPGSVEQLQSFAPPACCQAVSHRSASGLKPRTFFCHAGHLHKSVWRLRDRAGWVVWRLHLQQVWPPESVSVGQLHNSSWLGSVHLWPGAGQVPLQTCLSGTRQVRTYSGRGVTTTVACATVNLRSDVLKSPPHWTRYCELWSHHDNCALPSLTLERI